MSIAEHIKEHEIIGVKTTVKKDGIKIATTDKLNFTGTGVTLAKSGSSVVINISAVGVVTIQGSWNASTNVPNISGTTVTGYAWLVTVAGNTNLGGISTWDVGDIAVKTDTGWLKVDNAEYASQIINDSNVVGSSVKDALNNLLGTDVNRLTTVGVYSIEPTLTDNGNGTANLGSFDVCLRNAPYGPIQKYTISAVNNISFTDGGAEYIYVNYNSGTPIVGVTTNYTIFDNATIVPVYKCWRVGNVIHSLSGDSMGYALPEKIATMLESTMAYNRAGKSGLLISETATPNPRTIIVTPSYVYAGTVGIMVQGYNSSTDLFTKATVANGVWTYSSVSHVYDNTNCNPITGEIPLGNNDYGVRWFYRSIGDVKEVFYVECEMSFSNFANAEKAAERGDLPTIIKQHCVLVGRAIIRKGATSGVTDSAFQVNYSGSSVISHNDTSNIQGGAVGEYYHLTSSQVDKITEVSKTMTYNLDGTLNVITDSHGTKTMGWAGGKLVSITGTGIYKSKTFAYSGDTLIGVTVL